MTETFTVNNKQYEVKKDLKFGEYRKISQVNSKITELSNQFSENTPTDQLQKLASELSTANNEQMQVIVDFLTNNVGLTQEQIDNLSLVEAIQVFQEAFKLSTTPKKKSEQIYG